MSAFLEYCLSAALVQNSVKISFVYAALVFLGGIIGFVKAKSKASLIASSIIAMLIVGLAYVALQVNELAGLSLLCVLSLGLGIMFKGKWDKPATPSDLSQPLGSEAPPKKKFMPFGLLTLMSVLVFVLMAYSLAVVLSSQPK
mmetsp:Transcript_124488/g.311289  ORF Transcript_124488/g.311289 Transcript_124488/m.311289 type:complete len:143 (+) Transcript_124488:85-513(+)|eukprot:CAMPEP_0115253570 /NCGR_PEP_ID=MMETSP0270-20121206/44738_1 /TAXON_ID=71861 /ORGANISM="Scrippsiella trochoidea, Strain CCMP3099" /LENGTH=142 /DNA_ID=CAMNT_0002669075 /DNA_START=83 /DNA_END=511 /DNA_ORIENTATION=-